MGINQHWENYLKTIIVGGASFRDTRSHRGERFRDTQPGRGTYSKFGVNIARANLTVADCVADLQLGLD